MTRRESSLDFAIDPDGLRMPVSGASKPGCPSLYQVSTRVWLTHLARDVGHAVTLDDIPDDELDRIADLGFDWVWLLSVWTTGMAGQRVSRSHREWRREFEDTLPDLAEDDIAGSGFAITAYAVHPMLGGNGALARLRERLRERRVRLMLDFVPNHTALDHSWVESHPDYYVAGTELALAREPRNYTWIRRRHGDVLLAHGRDPYFAGWPDTLQLDYGNPATQEAMVGELSKIADQCDGVRCDMAMLMLPDVFERTWGRRALPFWPQAIRQIRDRVPGFTFMAEVYWDLEWQMQQQGFDYAYDKRLYDRLREGHARPVREHLRAGLDYQNKLARFLENHDEQRAAAAFAPEAHQAAAIIAYLSPGLRFFHQGQLDGYRKRISPHLVRGPEEPGDAVLQAFYARLLAVLRDATFRNGMWQQVECAAAWDGNPTAECYVAALWQSPSGERRLVAVNYAPNRSQCYLRLPIADLQGQCVRLRDLTGTATYDRNADELVARGLYLDVPAWGYHVFDVAAATFPDVAPRGTTI